MNELDKSKYQICISDGWPSGLRNAWSEAELFSGENGHIAMSEEIGRVRLQSNVKDPIWNFNITCSNSIYFGIGQKGIPIMLVVRRDNGPLKTISTFPKYYGMFDGTPYGAMTRKHFLQIEKLGEPNVKAISLVDYFSTEKSFASKNVDDLVNSEILELLLGLQKKVYVEGVSEIIRNNGITKSLFARDTGIVYRIFPKEFVNDLSARKLSGYFENNAICSLVTLSSISELRAYGHLFTFPSCLSYIFVGVKK